MNRDKIEKGVRLILEGVGENVGRDGLKETPSRVAKMMENILSGIGENPALEAGISEEMEDDIIIVKDIPFYSMCEHHLLPFFGKVHLAYLPQSNRVAGFSSLVGIVDSYSKRLQIQERLTNQIADSLMENLKSKGAMVVVQAQQLCVCMRGKNKDSVRTITQAVRGDFNPDRLERVRLFEK